MIVQKVAFVVAGAIFVEWFVFFAMRLANGPIYHLVPINIRGDAAPVFGTIMFNYAMVVTVPSWCNEKTHSTQINKALGISIILGTVLFLIIGIFGALTYHISNEGDLLSTLDSGNGGIIVAISVFLFPISVVATSIPIYSIIVRYNLLENKICNKPVANFIGVILPWLVTIPFYTGQGLLEVMNWSTLISNGLINFIIPFWLYINAITYKMSLDRIEIDEALDEEYKDPDEVYFFGKYKIKGGNPAPPHFAFGTLFSHDSIAPKLISLTFLVTLSIAVVGVIVINILAKVHVH
jgi:hypothetical protein